MLFGTSWLEGKISPLAIMGAVSMARRRDEKTKDLFAYAEDNRPSIVYMATNTVNGKRYIGITRLTLERRRQSHKGYANAGSTSYFHRALRKYSIEAFVFETIRQCPSYKAACAEEQRLISEHVPEYNMSAGGDGPIGYRHSPESRAKMSASAKLRPAPWTGKKRSPESIAKRTATRALNPVRPWLGKKRDPETMKKIGLKLRKWVMCIDDGKVYHGLQAAADAYGIPRYRDVADVCSGKHKSAKGKRFKYVDNVEDAA